MKFTFPEQVYVDPDKIAIAITGGGIRTMICMLGYFRCLLRYDPDFLKRTSYISTSSGGSWFNAILTFSKCEIDELLGESIPIDEISSETLHDYNFNNKNYMGNVMVHCPIMETFLHAKRVGIESSEIWEYVCSKNFLYPYGLDAKFVCDSEETAQFHKDINHINCIYPRKNFPFWICGASIVDNSLSHTTSCEFTPLYSGIRVPNKKYGGIFFENPGFNGRFKCIPKHDCRQNLYVSKYRNNYIDNFISCSSCAYGAFFRKCYNERLFFSDLLKNLNPKANCWGIMSNRGHETDIYDGGYIDNTGILNLAARGCKKILAFVNCAKFNNNYCNLEITHLFGLEKELKCSMCEFRKNSAIFSIDDWIEMRHDFEKRIKDDKIPYFYKKLKVYPNWKSGINGNYETELLIIPLFPNHDFNNKLKINLTSPEYTELNCFPNFELFYFKEGIEINFTKMQVNMLSTYCDWILQKVIEEKPDFFN